MAKEVWRERPGPIGGLDEKEYREQRGLPQVDPVTAIKIVLRAVRYEEPVRIVSREYDATGGFRLTDRMVTRLEVLNAVSRLPFPLQETLSLVYLGGLTRRQAAQVLGLGNSRFSEYTSQAWEAVVAMIFDYCPKAASGTNGTE